MTTLMREDPYVEQGLECPVCGGTALPGEIRCNYCGARLQAEGADAAQSPRSSEVGDSQGFSSPGPNELGYTTAYTSAPAAPKQGRRAVRILGFSSAAVVALAAGAWFALYLGNKHKSPGATATPAATVASAPIVELAKLTPISIQSDIAGTLPRDVDALLKAFNGNKAGLANVYGNALSSDPSLSDGMLVRLHILPDGTVDNGAVETSTSGNPSFDAEVVEAMTSWKFDSVKGSAVAADYRLIFAPSTDGAAAVESDLNTKLASLSPSEPPEYAFSPSGATPSALAEGSPSAESSASAGGSALPATPVAVGTPASEPTMMAALPPAPPVANPESTPGEMSSGRPRVRHRRRPPPELAALPPPKPPLIERVDSELRSDRRLRRVQAYTNGSVVTIFGKVFDDKDRLLAEQTVRHIDGVSAVINTVTTDTQQWEQNQNAIAQALQNAGLNSVQVKVIGQDAYLSGQVKTELDRERAVTIAEGAAPIKVRENLITVALGNMLGF
jgi:TonB family protein